MTLATGGFALAVLALGVAWLGWLRRRAAGRGGARAPTNDEKEPRAATAAKPTAIGTPCRAAASMGHEAGPRHDGDSTQPHPAPTHAAAVATMPAAVPPSSPRGMTIDAAGADAWNDAEPLDFAPVHRRALATCLAPSLARLHRAAGAPLRYAAFRFPPGVMLAWARSEQRLVDAALPAPSPSASSAPGDDHGLTAGAASALAAAVLAGLAELRYLAALGDEIHALRDGLDALPLLADDAPAAGSAALVQDLARWLRDARAHYAATLVRTAARERSRFADAQARSVTLWREVHVRVDAARQRLALAVGTPRHDERQLEDALAAAGELLEQRALQVFAARVLAAFEMLRLALGEPLPSLAAASPLASAEAALRTGADEDRALAPRLRAFERARDTAPDLPAADFEQRSEQLRERLYRLGEVAQGTAHERLAAASAAVAAGFPLRSGADDAWLVEADDALAIVAVRRARIGPRIVESR